MKRTLSVIISSLAIVLIAAYVYKPSVEISQKEQRIKEAIELNILRTKDLSLGYPPVERLVTAMEDVQRLQSEQAASNERNTFTEARWRERGPNNVGGRTRSILIDKNDPDRNTIWAGSVSGGLWKSTNIASSNPQWEKVSDFLDNLNIGSLAQDPNNPQIIYAGTGEAIGNSVRFPGLGIYRTTDGGETWERMAATANFRVSQSLFVHPETSDLYAATLTKGLQRSQDQGETWQKVAGYIPSAQDFASNNVFDIKYANSSGYIYISTQGSVRRSISGDQGDWDTRNGSGFPSGLSRIELAVSNSDPEILYFIGAQSGTSSPLYASTNGGDTWVARARPAITGAGYSQAWYDLEIEVSPFNPLHLIAGEIGVQRSFDGGMTWGNFASGIHSDHHKVVFDEEIEGRIYFGNDGGVWRSTNGTSVSVRNNGYITTQFYGCAIHPEAEKDYFLAGAQDNGSWKIEGFGAARGSRASGGDGFLCHIDENEPQNQLVCSQFGNWQLSTNGGESFSGGASVNGGFLNPSDLDSESNIFYTETNDGDYYRWNIETGVTEVADVANFNLNISIVYADPNVANRVYFGSFNGQVYRVDNAHDDALAVSESLGTFSGSISSFDVETENPDHILISISNYGSQSIYETKDGGDNWKNVEGNLPDIPVNWAVFNPKNPSQALAATEMGVWVTELLDDANTIWSPPALGIGTPLTRVTQLEVRRSDNVILASTYGRGLFTTDVFAEPKAKMVIDQIGYTQAPLKFSGEVAINASSWLWDFGDGESSTDESTTHTFGIIGEYPVSLTINDDLTTTSPVKVLPDHGLPYESGTAEYGGDFEGNTEQYGVFTVSGSSFSRGNSTMPGKDGVHSGANAFVLGIDEEYYQNGTHSMVYIPNFNMEEPGIYEFSFWTKFRLNNGLDGMRVEYSTNRGESWAQLGSTDDPNWYNFKNNNLNNAGFSQGASYFSGTKNAYVRYAVDISQFAGQKDVAFRFVFKSGASGNFRGIAIDDIQISKYDGELATKLLSFSGEFTEPTEITLTWLTQPEYRCVEFQLERSINGFDFEEIETIPAEGKTSANMFTYETTTLGQRNLYFFRLKVINAATDYSYEFYSPTIVVRKNLEGVAIQYIFPNPIEENIFLTFTDVSEELADYELFAANGQLVAKGNVPAAGTATIPVSPTLSAGVYFLSIQVGEGEREVFKLLKN